MNLTSGFIQRIDFAATLRAIEVGETKILKNVDELLRKQLAGSMTNCKNAGYGVWSYKYNRQKQTITITRKA